jgi:DNA recombination protein RmuC
MVPTLAVAVMLCTVAGCCIYITYRVGQSISPGSRLIQRRLARVEAEVARSEARVERALEQHRQASGEQAARALRESNEALAKLVDSLRRPIDDLHQRLNGVRIDLLRASTDLQEDVQDTLGAMRDGTREDLGELARVHAESTEQLAGQLRDRGADDERRHEGTRALVERVAAGLSLAHAASVSEVRSTLAAHVHEVQETAAHIDRKIAEQGAQLGRTDQDLKAALRGSERHLDALQRAVDDRLGALTAHARAELGKLDATSTRQETMWREIKVDFDALSGSLLTIKRAIEVVRDQLTVPLRDVGACVDVNALLEQSLQPDEFERDVEVEPRTGRRVEFAVKLSDNPLTKVWLPVAVLSAVDGYHELVAASFYGNAEQMNGTARTFDTCVLDAARDLHGTFIVPPQTMNLAILFVPTNDLFEEIARRDNLVETLRRHYHVIVAGPTTLPTLVRGLREAFRGTAPSTTKAANGSAVRPM